MNIGFAPATAHRSNINLTVGTIRMMGSLPRWAGRFFPRGTPRQSTRGPRPSKRAGGVPDRSAFDPKDSRNYSVVKVKEGDSLGRIAKQRRGVTVADLAWLNDLDAQKPLQVGQSIKLPNQAFLDEGRDARNKFLGLAYYMDTHGGKLPPNPAHPPSLDSQIEQERIRRVSNGYAFDLDILNRPREAEGRLQLNPNQGRSRAAQASAGKPDRRPTDDGGHLIAGMFNGPKEPFNHFAQDRTFNRGAYLQLEKYLAREKESGKDIRIRIEALNEVDSKRPFAIRYHYTVNGVKKVRIFPNGAK